jgi:hypothetical protein
MKDRANLMFQTAQAVNRCYFCKERLFGQVHRQGQWPDWEHPPDAEVFSPPVWAPLWIGLHYPTCEQAFGELIQTPPYRHAAQGFIRRVRRRLQ